MNTLILFDSQYGNTELVARVIADLLETGGETRVERISDASAGDLHGIDLLILGCPTQAWQMTPATKSFLSRLPSEPLPQLAVACFDTRIDKPRLITGSAAFRIAARLRRVGVNLIAPPENFLVTGTEGPLAEGELEHAIAWAHDLVHSVHAQRTISKLITPAA